MRPTALRATVGSALLGLFAQPVVASTVRRHAHQQYSNNHAQHSHGVDENLELLKPRGRLVNRSGQCAFPEGEYGLVTITPSSTNKGWAMSPDQECTAGSYCPFACEPGMVMNQWKDGTSYQYPESLDGGLYCDESGEIQKPFPHQPYCVDGVGTVNAVNNCNDVVAFCQTVLPGNEAMLIPTSVSGSSVIAVPGPSYWDSTASHFYINPPGYSTEEACAWGTGSEAIGNWSPYVAGANQDSTGNTFVKIGYNPIYTGAFDGVKPSFGVKIECDGDCNGLPCSIDPSSNDFGVVLSAEAATGAGGADFCVVTVPGGVSANIVVFHTDESAGADSNSSDSNSDSDSGSDWKTPSSSSSAQPKTTHTTSQYAIHKTTASPSSSYEKPTTTPESHKLKVAAVTTTSSSSTPTTVSTSSSRTTSTPSSSSKSTTIPTTTTTTTSRHSSTTFFSSTTTHGAIFHESMTSSTQSFDGYEPVSATSSAELADVTAMAVHAAAATSSKSDAVSSDQGRAASAGLVVAFIAAAMLY